jgi:NADPH:quinone reductase-like Zn-dependent oxidoreductase
MRDTIGGHYDAVLDTIGMQDTEAFGINSLRRGGHYMTLQVYENQPFNCWKNVVDIGRSQLEQVHSSHWYLRGLLWE